MKENASVIFNLMQHAGVLIAVFDDKDRLRFANDRFRAAFDLSGEDAPTWAEMMRANHEKKKGTPVEAADFEKWLISARSRRGKVPFRGFEADLQEGAWIWMTETVGPEGWMLCIAVDITTLSSRDRNLRQDRDLALRASRTDELTGIANRRQVMEKLEELVFTNGGGSIAVVDLDHFKSINDAHGHAGGDIVLVDFARRTEQCLRRTDSFGRIGGEEFLFVFPGLKRDEATAILARIQAEIRLSRPLLQVPDFSYSFSAGLAEIMPGECASAVFSRADSACYDAKKAGRNRIVAT